MVDTTAVQAEEGEKLTLKSSRPASPSKQSLDRQVFDSEQPTEAALADRVAVERWPSRKSIDRDAKMEHAALASQDIRSNQQTLMEKAMDAMKKSKSPPDSILSSAVGFYSAHATMLAAAIIGMCYMAVCTIK